MTKNGVGPKKAVFGGGVEGLKIKILTTFVKFFKTFCEVYENFTKVFKKVVKNYEKWHFLGPSSDPCF
jgi:hypothetical protein